jgi:hypothetical protein
MAIKVKSWIFSYTVWIYSYPSRVGHAQYLAFATDPGNRRGDASRSGLDS